MKTRSFLAVILATGSLLFLAAPADAQQHRNNGGGGRGGNVAVNRGHWNGHGWRGGPRVGVYFGGYPYYGYGWGPYWGYGYGYPYYYGGYPYYGYPAGYPYYGYSYGAPDGVYQGRVANPPRSTNDGRGKDAAITTKVQRGLASAGYYDGAIDGVNGEGTKRAIRSYKRANGLPVDSRIDEQLLDSMGRG